jgi:hypothetical protein
LGTGIITVKSGFCDYTLPQLFATKNIHTNPNQV